ncbi:hypothetical protein SARC_02846 [Sphaeroforma arctica JP610]|uniref:Uncharacterized protein n=1 Tax=Sphaeroforma arctica JP610 TaxID=667725 RepID=A0A0L0G7H8_9EUKA|nr:hypothetical protein SARC_02846 [Sphaeroforma arctica JP610]KNC84955.1 hypothetical protein SARC_02846 [Sphaeroforma arctica JP610]|eukprot:XP_014158857.1 hypothetical protein SARC_02846 [Sphaeroforma arctica JP610]
MTILDLQIKADLENVTDLTTDPDDFRWYLKVRCGCGEENNKWLYLEADDFTEIPGARGGEANLVVKCDLCSRTNSISLVDKPVRAYTKSGEYQTIAAFDCRGVEPIAFDPRVCSQWGAQNTCTHAHKHAQYT